MAIAGSVTLGSKNVDLEAFTGEVVESRVVEYTQTETDQHGRRWRRSTSYWSNFTVRNAEGAQHDIEVWQSIADVSNGQQVTAFWGVKGKKATNWLAIYNHATDRLGFVPGPLNKLAGPGGNWHGVMLFGCGIIQFFTLFALFEPRLSAWITFLVLCAPYFWVYQRRQTLRQAIRDAIPRVGLAQPVTANAAPPVAQDREIRI